jgi:hypothetical protein
MLLMIVEPKNKINLLLVQSTALQAIQNCQTSQVDFQPYLLYHEAQI